MVFAFLLVQLLLAVIEGPWYWIFATLAAFVFGVISFVSFCRTVQLFMWASREAARSRKSVWEVVGYPTFGWKWAIRDAT